MCSECEFLLAEIEETQLEISELRQDIIALTRYKVELIRVIRDSRARLEAILRQAQAEMASCPKMRYAYLKGPAEAANQILQYLNLV